MATRATFLLPISHLTKLVEGSEIRISKFSIYDILLDPINDKSALRAWCQIGTKPLSKPMMTQFPDINMHDLVGKIWHSDSCIFHQNTISVPAFSFCSFPLLASTPQGTTGCLCIKAFNGIQSHPLILPLLWNVEVRRSATISDQRRQKSSASSELLLTIWPFEIHFQ